jgi:steroid delta-isomerase-like uncharacterized protein
MFSLSAGRLKNRNGTSISHSRPLTFNCSLPVAVQLEGCGIRSEESKGQRRKAIMSEQENMQVIRANIEAWNGKNAEASRQLRTTDFTAEVSGVPNPLNAEELWQFWQSYLTAFSETRMEATLMIAQGDYVVAHYTTSGVHTKPLRTPNGSTIPATGKKVAVKGCFTYELRGGKIRRQWDFADMLSLLRQLGLNPPI